MLGNIFHISPGQLHENKGLRVRASTDYKVHSLEFGEQESELTLPSSQPILLMDGIR